MNADASTGLDDSDIFMLGLLVRAIRLTFYRQFLKTQGDTQKGGKVFSMAVCQLSKTLLRARRQQVIPRLQQSCFVLSLYAVSVMELALFSSFLEMHTNIKLKDIFHSTENTHRDLC